MSEQREQNTTAERPTITVKQLKAAWMQYCVLFGTPPHGTTQQLAALIELIPDSSSESGLVEALEITDAAEIARLRAEVERLTKLTQSLVQKCAKTADTRDAALARLKQISDMVADCMPNETASTLDKIADVAGEVTE